MNTAGQRVCVLGLGASGRAAVELLLAQGAQVTAIDAADNASLRDWAASMGQGAELRLGESGLIKERFDLCVLSPGIAVTHPQVIQQLYAQFANKKGSGEENKGLNKKDATNNDIRGREPPYHLENWDEGRGKN